MGIDCREGVTRLDAETVEKIGNSETKRRANTRSLKEMALLLSMKDVKVYYPSNRSVAFLSDRAGFYEPFELLRETGSSKGRAKTKCEFIHTSG
ncbi:hypothetical protein L1987_08951 [Smallanthus sonchifolius]|uniref:Uncharacterized protein n=1 Tax=Smallanthus sonchifolius TaxID=185202 RepID=A0ACB9JM27_9ASTR|nr:hypothetical protein L1987_08951 [Smallanthus sonchifolius]